jgi:AcrR family transcriptional regulator
VAPGRPHARPHPVQAAGHGRSVAGALTLSASIFALFLYLTLYIQDDLGYGPLAAGVRFLPSHHAGLHRGSGRRQAHRAHPDPVPARDRPAPDLGRLPAHGHHPRRLGLDGAPARVHRGRDRDRHGQPRAGLVGHLGGTAPAQRHGLGGQQHLPPGRASPPASPAWARSSSPRSSSRTLAALRTTPAGKAVVAHGVPASKAPSSEAPSIRRRRPSRRPRPAGCAPRGLPRPASRPRSTTLMVIGAVIALSARSGRSSWCASATSSPAWRPPLAPAADPLLPGGVGGVTTVIDPEHRPVRHGRARGADRAGPGTSGSARPSPSAALRQLHELGYAKVSMESVACEAGVARATIYRRYRDKADLITAAIADNSTSHLVDRPSDDPRADLVAYLDEFDQRFAEGCLEVVGTLIGVRQDPGALALHRQRVVGPRMRLCPVAARVRAQVLGQLRRRRRPRPGPADVGRVGVRPAGGRGDHRGRLGRAGRRRRLGRHGSRLSAPGARLPGTGWTGSVAY